MAKKDFHHYCRVYDHFLSPEMCDEYIRLYEETIRVDSKKVRDLSVCFRPDGKQICGNCNCMRLNPQEYDRFFELNSVVIPKFMDVINQYKEDTNLHKVQWPKKYGFEELRIKRFLIEGTDKENDNQENNYHGLDYHVDIYSHAHAKRFLCLMIYLNDDFDDGLTYFPILESGVKPKKGTIFLFPPSWVYLHNGTRPLANNRTTHFAKYFLMTHTNYIDMITPNEGTEFSSRKETAYDQNSKEMNLEELRWPGA